MKFKILFFFDKNVGDISSSFLASSAYTNKSVEKSENPKSKKTTPDCTNRKATAQEIQATLVTFALQNLILCFFGISVENEHPWFIIKNLIIELFLSFIGGQPIYLGLLKLTLNSLLIKNVSMS